MLKNLWPSLNNVILLVWQSAVPPQPFSHCLPAVTHQAITLTNDLQHPHSAHQHWQDLQSNLELAFISVHLSSSLLCRLLSIYIVMTHPWLCGIENIIIYNIRDNFIVYLAASLVDQFVDLCHDNCNISPKCIQTLSVMRRNTKTLISVNSVQGGEVEQCNMPSTVLWDKCNVQHGYYCQKSLCLFQLGQRCMVVYWYCT